MWKALSIGCGVLLVLGVAAVAAAILLVPRLLDVAQQTIVEEQERQAIAAGWEAPDRGAAPARVFPAAVGEYRLEQADERAAVPELGFDAPGVHAAYARGPSRVEVFAYPTSKLEAEASMTRAEQAYQRARGNGTKSWSKVALGESYARAYLSAPGLGQNHLWYAKGWLLVFRTADTEDREAFVREFLRTRPGPEVGGDR